MAKKRARAKAPEAGELPSLETASNPAPVADQPQESLNSTIAHLKVAETPEEETKTTFVSELSQVSVSSIPFMTVGKKAHRSRRVDVQNMSGKQRDNLKCIVMGLQSEGAKLENGRFVQNYSDAIKWILENVKP